MRFEAKQYQAYCIRKILHQKEVGLFLDMGMGKTVITLSAIELLRYDYFEDGKVLVIAPLRPAEETWPEELEKWDHLKDLSYSLVLGLSAERTRALLQDADIYIINRENVSWLVNFYKNRWPFKIVVIDELSSFKSNRAKRFQALKKVRQYIDRIIGLTGTPVPNGLLDLWSQVYLLDGGKALGRTLTSYRDGYFLPDKRNAQVIYSWKLKPGAEQQIYERLEGLCVSMKTSDYLRLPEKIDVRHEVRLGEREFSLYRQMERDLLLPFADGDIDAGSAGVLVNKLLQIAGGAAYDENGNVKRLHPKKLEALDTLIEEANGKPVLIFYAYKHERDRIIERYDGVRDIKASGSVKAWNNGEIPILIAHPASAGHGLNLQAGGNIIIWFGLPLSLELYQQANKRLHRMGQESTVLIHHLVVKDTVDEWVLDKVLTGKAERQEALIEAVEIRRKEVLSDKRETCKS